jgi:4-amino-4-deoxy-L-arabinose transferase-like glycosyltransferase
MTGVTPSSNPSSASRLGPAGLDSPASNSGRHLGENWRWLAIFVLTITLVTWLLTLNAPYALQDYAWGDASEALMARSFATEGIVHLHGIPVPNNPPQGNQPDVYLHWPPLFPILLAVVFKIFGVSVFAVRAFVLLLNLVYLGTFYVFAKHFWGKQIAVLALFGAVTVPVFVFYSTLVWAMNIVLALIMAAIYCFVRASSTDKLEWRWALAGMSAVVAGSLLSWEPVLLGFVLFLVAMTFRSASRMALAALYAASGVVTAAIVLFLFVKATPWLRADLWETLRYRMGATYSLGQVPIHSLVNRFWYQDQNWSVWKLIVQRPTRLIGSIGLLSLIAFLIWTWEKRSKKRDELFAVGGLLGVWLGWFVIFPNHVYIHLYDWLLAVPLIGISIAWLLVSCTTQLTGSLRIMGSIVLPILLAYSLLSGIQEAIALRGVYPSVLQYSQDIFENVPASAVVLSPNPSAVVTYYSQRHIIRYVKDDQVLGLVNRQVWSIFPSSDVYLALRDSDLSLFPCATSHFSVVKKTSNLTLLKVVPQFCVASEPLQDP